MANIYPIMFLFRLFFSVFICYHLWRIKMFKLIWNSCVVLILFLYSDEVEEINDYDDGDIVLLLFIGRFAM